MMSFDEYETWWMDRIAPGRQLLGELADKRHHNFLCKFDYECYKMERDYVSSLLKASAARAAETRTGSISVVNTPLRLLENNCVHLTQK